MIWRHFWTLAALGGLLVLPGCTRRHCCDSAVLPGSSPDSLPVCQRSFPDGLKPVSASFEDLPKLAPEYRLLPARECQCVAAQVSAQANILDREGEWTIQKAEAKKLGRNKVLQGAAFKAQMLNYLALEDRNKSAGKALDFYYRLGEAEANADILQSMLTQVSDALEKARALKAKGLQVPVDETMLHRQKLDLQTQNVQQHLQIQQFNGELRRLLAFEPCAGEWQFWPVEAFHVTGECVDVEQAVTLGLGSRPILLMLNMLEAELSSGDPAMVRAMLAMINNVLGQDPACPCLHKLLSILCDQSAEQEVRLEQLAIYHADKEREVVEDIRQAARSIHGQKDVVLLAHQKAESLFGKVREAEEKENKGLGSFADTTETRVNWLKARRSVIEETIKLQRAWVQLRQAQGILPAECDTPVAPPDAHIQPVPITDVEALPAPRPIMPQ